MVRDLLADQKNTVLDLKAIDTVIESIPRENRGNTAYEVAAHLTASGQLAEAKRYWLTVADSGNTNFWWRVIAKSIFRERYRNQASGRAGPREV